MQDATSILRLFVRLLSDLSINVNSELNKGGQELQIGLFKV